ncbi:MAG: ribokinase, partial [Opitutales bacterium]|nr:ribokinase [Opitutales bacterium]
HEGGKGANQAMAAKTLYEDTLFCAGMGDDSIGRDYLAYLQNKGMDTSLVKIFKGSHTGVALITVGKEGQNIITVAPGANLKLSPADMQNIDFSQFSHVAFQLETNIDTVEEGLKLAKKAGCTTILTPAPAKLLSDEILKNVDWLVPNEIEILQVQRGFTSMKTAAESLLSKGVGNVIVTLGERGCALFNDDGEQRFSTFSVRPIDTVGAGDCFTGAFMAGLKMFDKIDQAITFANAAASLKVTKVGAQSYATQKEVLKLMKTK